MLVTLIWLAIGGLIIGGLGRLLVLEPNPIGLIRTALAGLAGSFLGGLVARYAIGLHCLYSLVVGFVPYRDLRRDHCCGDRPPQLGQAITAQLRAAVWRPALRRG
jgi:uncharacterized membrane protein YeaQ/YmgE (transglycosylase-associated protein family)